MNMILLLHDIFFLTNSVLLFLCCPLTDDTMGKGATLSLFSVTTKRYININT